MNNRMVVAMIINMYNDDIYENNKVILEERWNTYL